MLQSVNFAHYYPFNKTSHQYEGKIKDMSVLESKEGPKASHYDSIGNSFIFYVVNYESILETTYN